MSPAAVIDRARRQALELLDQGDVAAASGVLSVALCRDPDSGPLWACRARVRSRRQDWAGALADMETALTLAPLSAEAQMTLGDCYRHAQRPALALVAYEHLLAQPRLSDAVYAGLYAGLKACRRPDLALQACRAAVQANPQNHQALFAVAHCLAACGGADTDIVDALRGAVALAPRMAAYRISLAIRLAAGGDNAAAYAQLCEAEVDCLRGLQCAYSARRLLAACRSAGDPARCAALEEALVQSPRRGRGRGGL